MCHCALTLLSSWIFSPPRTFHRVRCVCVSELTNKTCQQLIILTIWCCLKSYTQPNWFVGICRNGWWEQVKLRHPKTLEHKCEHCGKSGKSTSMANNKYFNSKCICINDNIEQILRHIHCVKKCNRRLNFLSVYSAMTWSSVKLTGSTLTYAISFFVFNITPDYHHNYGMQTKLILCSVHQNSYNRVLKCNTQRKQEFTMKCGKCAVFLSEKVCMQIWRENKNWVQSFFSRIWIQFGSRCDGIQYHWNRMLMCVVSNIYIGSASQHLHWENKKKCEFVSGERVLLRHINFKWETEIPFNNCLLAMLKEFVLSVLIFLIESTANFIPVKSTSFSLLFSICLFVCSSAKKNSRERM